MPGVGHLPSTFQPLHSNAFISRSKTTEAEEEVGSATIDPTRMRATMMLAGGVLREILKDSF